MILMRESKYDFLKGVAVSFVILLHTLDNESLNSIGHIYHIGHAVPIFVLVTFILSFMTLAKRSGTEIQYWYSTKRWITMFRKVLFPYVVLQGCFLLLLIITKDTKHMHSMLIGGGIGPGSYYPWIYLQFWLVMPLLYLILKRTTLFVGCVIFFLLNEIMQISCCYFNVSDHLYRLLACRYLFLAFLGYLFWKIDIRKYVYAIFAAIGVMYYLSLDKVDYVPFLFNSWMTQQLPAFFYTILLMKVLLLIFDRMKMTIVGYYFVLLGENSWYIFLLQMLFVTITSIKMLSFIPSKLFQSILYVIIVYVLSVTPMIVYSKYKR